MRCNLSNVHPHMVGHHWVAQSATGPVGIFLRVLPHTACPVRTTQNRSEATSVGGADFGHSLNLSPKPDPLHAPCPAHAPAARSHVATCNELPLALAPGSPPGDFLCLRWFREFFVCALRRRAQGMRVFLLSVPASAGTSSALFPPLRCGAPAGGRSALRSAGRGPIFRRTGWL